MGIGNWLKEDAKNEKAIRSLLKQPGNSKCINCDSRGPQYICTTFWTFVCATCSGIHREFTHRVKSVSMGKFTPEEVNHLKAGGNERAKEIYFKEVDLHRVPDNSNLDKLRDFIKHVYVDRRYTGEKIAARPSIVKMDDREETHDSRRRDSSQSNQQPIVIRRSPIGTGIVNDWRREDRFSNGKKSEVNPKVEAKLPDSKKCSNGSTHPAIQPITDLLGETSISLHVIEPAGTSTDKTSDGSSHMTQISTSSKSPPEIKMELSLIDFDAECEPQPLSESTSVAADNSHNLDIMDGAPHVRPAQVPHGSDPMSSVYTQLSLPAPQASLELVPVQNVDAKTSGRNELPADIFTALYAPQPAHVPVWHTGLAPGISYSVQYNTAGQPMACISQPTNPFDIGNGSSPAQAPQFPGMTSLQNALPNMHTSSLGMATPSWMPSHTQPQPQPQPQASPYLLGSPQDAYKVDQFSNLSQRPQGVDVFPASIPMAPPPNTSVNPFG